MPLVSAHDELAMLERAESTHAKRGGTINAAGINKGGDLIKRACALVLGGDYGILFITTLGQGENIGAQKRHALPCGALVKR